MRATELLAVLGRKRRKTFSTAELIEWTRGSAVAVRAMVRRLRAEKTLATPVRGFHVLTPDGKLGPPIEWIDGLMRELEVPYGVAGWSAARLHGVEVPPDRVLHVRVNGGRRPIRCASGRVEFFTLGARWNYEPLTHEGVADRLMVSSPADVLFELMMDASTKRGGVARVLSALPVLAEQADPWGLIQAARDAPLTWSARLGFLLEWAGSAELGNVLAPLVREFLTVDAVLDPHLSTDGARLDEKWRVRINMQLPEKRR